ncbi:hypothetical protein BG015_009104, partial [Linnemannia schmuckeri]
MNAREHLTIPEINFFGSQTVAGVQHLHKMELIHRELKLAKFLLSTNLNIKVCNLEMKL